MEEESCQNHMKGESWAVLGLGWDWRTFNFQQLQATHMCPIPQQYPAALMYEQRMQAVTVMSSFASARWIQQAKKEGCWPRGYWKGLDWVRKPKEGGTGGLSIMPRKRQEIKKIEGLLSARLKTDIEWWRLRLRLRLRAEATSGNTILESAQGVVW